MDYVEGTNKYLFCSCIMNLFYLDDNAEKCAQYHCDKHVVKMILETAQLLSTAHRVLDGEQYVKLSKNNRRLKYWRLPDDREEKLYQVFGVNHPVSAWVRFSSENYKFAYSLFKELIKEYWFRYDKSHKSEELIIPLSNLPNNIPDDIFIKPALAMPEQYYNSDPVKAYRDYYKFDKKEILSYTKRNKPNWLGG